MRKHLARILLAGAALLAVAGAAQAQSDLQCSITTKSGDRSVYTFHGLPGSHELVEVGYSKNGVPQSDGGHWRDATVKGLYVLVSENDPSYALAVGPRSAGLKALLLHKVGTRLNPVGAGFCTYVPMTASYTPAPAPRKASGRDSVPIYSTDTRAELDVSFGSLTARFVIDTGAQGMSLTTGLARQLLSRGEARLGPSRKWCGYDGACSWHETIVIRRLSIGSHTITDVLAVVAGDGAMDLLPFPVLNRFGKFSIDTAVGELVFG
jgi:hypothetical protein